MEVQQESLEKLLLDSCLSLTLEATGHPEPLKSAPPQPHQAEAGRCPEWVPVVELVTAVHPLKFKIGLKIRGLCSRRVSTVKLEMNFSSS